MPYDLLDKVCSKLTTNKISYNIVNSEYPDTPDKLKFKILAGREEIDCMLYEDDKVFQKINESNFEKYRFILGYEAIWSCNLREIECEVIESGNLCRPVFRNKILGKLSRFVPDNMKTSVSIDSDGFHHEEIINLELQPIDNIKVSIGLCSDEFAILSVCRQLDYDLDRLQKSRVTLKLSECDVNSHDEAYKIMETISNSLFFQIDLVANLSINLVTQRESRSSIFRTKKRVIAGKENELKEIKNEYDPEPMSFYWHAKNSSIMPLFQFLAYYQTIEFYFPVYSNIEAKQKLQNLIKDPRFNPNRDADITRMLNSIKVSAGGKAFGNELEQLKATIKICVTEASLREFFESKRERMNFFHENKGIKLSKCKITFKSENSDIIKDVAERIYDIRCLIVHTKSDYKTLNPFSPEVKKITYDIELVEFIARHVLIASSRPIRLDEYLETQEFIEA